MPLDGNVEFNNKKGEKSTSEFLFYNLFIHASFKDLSSCNFLN